MLISAAVLAGGQARRMGGMDKRSIRVDDAALGQRVVDRLAAHFGEVIEVSAPCGSGASAHASRGARQAFDLVPGFGPLSGLHAALRACRTEWLYLVACDMPHFSAAWADHLQALAVRDSGAADGIPIRPLAYLAGFGRHIEPFHALYSVRCIEPLERLFGMPGGADAGRRPSIRDFLEQVPHMVIPEAEARAFSPDWDLFHNLNSPVDIDAYLARSKA